MAFWKVEEDVKLYRAHRAAYVSGCCLALSLEAVQFQIGAPGTSRSLSSIYHRRTGMREHYGRFVDAETVYRVVEMMESADGWLKIQREFNMNHQETAGFYRRCQFWYILNRDYHLPISGKHVRYFSVSEFYIAALLGVHFLCFNDFLTVALLCCLIKR